MAVEKKLSKYIAYFELFGSLQLLSAYIIFQNIRTKSLAYKKFQLIKSLSRSVYNLATWQDSTHMSVPTASYDSGLASQNLLQQDKHMMCHLCTVVHTVKGWAVLALSLAL